MYTSGNMKRQQIITSSIIGVVLLALVVGTFAWHSEKKTVSVAQKPTVIATPTPTVTPTPIDTTGWIKYTNYKNHFSIKLPPGIVPPSRGNDAYKDPYTGDELVFSSSTDPKETVLSHIPLFLTVGYMWRGTTNNTCATNDECYKKFSSNKPLIITKILGEEVKGSESFNHAVNNPEQKTFSPPDDWIIFPISKQGESFIFDLQIYAPLEVVHAQKPLIDAIFSTFQFTD